MTLLYLYSSKPHKNAKSNRHRITHPWYYIGTIYFGVQAIQQSESFNLLGYEVAVSSANWTPVIISAAVLINEILITAISRKKAFRILLLIRMLFLKMVFFNRCKLPFLFHRFCLSG